MSISKQDKTFIQKLPDLQLNSYDPHRPVAAVIVDQSGDVVSTGVNRPPERLGITKAQAQSEIAINPDWKYYMMEHGERNAIFDALAQGQNLRGATMYATLFPCADCARAIAITGIRRLVVPNAGCDSERDARWIEHYRYAKEVLELAEVDIEYYTFID
ncbi:deaminase [Afifella sp. H1R]|uniref:deaminase n=1 Tax=Afifella sp. H1R TaxID=2908841 RepID=UPI001F2D4CB4|nr:deaminase [Afifella sp. H1R]MCF1504010.1 deaminase [Afifella sp. H1R]